ncbi:MAG: hypothetical protein HY078_13910 [Elusimicrobia bacterium]|nr:hypothetical protein [Elusimicrobiota bacterium]
MKKTLTTVAGAIAIGFAPVAGFSHQIGKRITPLQRDLSTFADVAREKKLLFVDLPWAPSGDGAYRKGVLQLNNGQYTYMGHFEAKPSRPGALTSGDIDKSLNSLQLYPMVLGKGTISRERADSEFQRVAAQMHRQGLTPEKVREMLAVQAMTALASGQLSMDDFKRNDKTHIDTFDGGHAIHAAGFGTGTSLYGDYSRHNSQAFSPTDARMKANGIDPDSRARLPRDKTP